MKFKPGTFCTVPNKPVLAGLPPQAQVLFFWLCAHSNKDGVCFPSTALLAKECGVARSTIFRHLAVLEENGLVSRAERFSKSGKTSNYYQIILVDTDSPKNQIVSQKDMGSVTEGPSPVSQKDSNYIQYNKTHITLVRNTKPGEISPQGQFDVFYTAYPRHDGRQKASEAFLKISPDDDLLKVMITAINAQKQSQQWQSDGGKYIPMPATWLNGRRWEDELRDGNGNLVSSSSASSFAKKLYEKMSKNTI
jgi:DNA-binding transcriptional ArsR family regulator